MRILHFDYDDLQNPYAGGGQAKATRQIYSRLAKKHNVMVVTGNYPKARNGQQDGIEYTRLGVGSLGAGVSLLSYWLLIPLFALAKGRYADVVSEFFTAPFSTSLLPFVKTNVIGCPTFFDPKKLSEKYHIPFHYLTYLLLQKYKYLIANSNYIKQKVLQHHANADVYVVPRGIEPEYFEMTSDEGHYFLYIGRIDIYNKGLDLALLAWSQIIKSNPNYYFYIVGDGKTSEKQKIKDLISKYKIKKSVKLFGPVTGKLKLSLFTKAFAVIQPSRYETFSNVALETIASGKPLICFSINGLRWLPSKFVYKAKKVNEKSLQQAIQLCIDNDSLRKAKARDARIFAKKFTWERAAEEYERIFLRILN